MRGNERGTLGDKNAPDPPVKSQGNGGDQGGVCEGEREGRGADHGEGDEWGRRVVVGPTKQPLIHPQDPTARGAGGRSEYPTARARGGRPFATSAAAHGRQSPSRNLPPRSVAVGRATLPPHPLAVGKRVRSRNFSTRGSDPEFVCKKGQNTKFGLACGVR